MRIQLIHEYNQDGHLLFFGNLIGAYVRGKTLEEALKKINVEAESYCRWATIPFDGVCRWEIVQEKTSSLQICDADSDVLFNSERGELSWEEYSKLKALTLQSAKDFLNLYLSFPDKNDTVLARRKTFYGQVPVTANEMYEHTKNVTSYYFGEVNTAATNNGDIYNCRLQGFLQLEKQSDFLQNKVFEGSYNELWSLKKMLRRFIWHDRIHAKAMWRMGTKLCSSIANPFGF